MWDLLADVAGAFLSPGEGRRRWVRVLYVVLAVAAVAVTALIVVRTWPR